MCKIKASLYQVGFIITRFGVEGHSCAPLRSYKQYTFGLVNCVRIHVDYMHSILLFLVHSIVNSELSHFKSALSSLENTTAFGSTLFDVWTVNRQHSVYYIYIQDLFLYLWSNFMDLRNYGICYRLHIYMCYLHMVLGNDLVCIVNTAALFANNCLMRPKQVHIV